MTSDHGQPADPAGHVSRETIAVPHLPATVTDPGKHALYRAAVSRALTELNRRSARAVRAMGTAIRDAGKTSGPEMDDAWAAYHRAADEAVNEFTRAVLSAWHEADSNEDKT